MRRMSLLVPVIVCVVQACRGTHTSVSPKPMAAPSGDQIIAGYMGSVLVGFAAWRAFDEPSGHHSRVKDDWGYTPRAMRALTVGSFVGGTLGVWLRGKHNGSVGSF